MRGRAIRPFIRHLSKSVRKMSWARTEIANARELHGEAMAGVTAIITAATNEGRTDTTPAEDVKIKELFEIAERQDKRVQRAKDVCDAGSRAQARINKEFI